MAIGSATSNAPSRAFAGERDDRVGGKREPSGPDLAAVTSANSEALFGALATPTAESQRLSKLIASAKAAAVAAVAAPVETVETVETSKVKSVSELLAGVHFRKPVYKAEGETAVAKTDRPTSNTDTDPAEDTTDSTENAELAEETAGGGSADSGPNAGITGTGSSGAGSGSGGSATGSGPSGGATGAGSEGGLRRRRDRNRVERRPDRRWLRERNHGIWLGRRELRRRRRLDRRAVQPPRLNGPSCFVNRLVTRFSQARPRACGAAMSEPTKMDLPAAFRAGETTPRDCSPVASEPRSQPRRLAACADEPVPVSAPLSLRARLAVVATMAPGRGGAPDGRATPGGPFQSRNRRV